MLVTVRVRPCLVALCGVVALASLGCAGTMSREETMAEIDRLRAAVRQSEERVATMQVQQLELTRQVTLLSALMGAMSTEAAAQKKQGFTGNAAASVVIPKDPPKKEDSPDLEF